MTLDSIDYNYVVMNKLIYIYICIHEYIHINLYLHILNIEKYIHTHICIYIQCDYRN
jgi:hypothetical protein